MASIHSLMYQFRITSCSMNGSPATKSSAAAWS